MRRILATSLVALLLTLPVGSLAKPTPAILDSIRPVRWGSYDQYTTWRVVTHCTAFAVAPDRWVTAAHCVATVLIGKDGPVRVPIIADHDFFIDRHAAVVIFADFPADLAVLQTESLLAPPLRLAKSAPTYLTPITIAGYPYGLGPILAIGSVARPSLIMPASSGVTGVRMILSVNGCPGSSGSPAVNDKHEVVSVVQSGVSEGNGCAVLMAGSTYAELVRVVGVYFAMARVKEG